MPNKLIGKTKFSMASCLLQSLFFRLAYNEFGVPSQVVTLETFEDPKVEHPEEVVAKVLAVPVHPSHINTIQGTYPVKVIIYRRHRIFYSKDPLKRNFSPNHTYNFEHVRI